MDRVKKLEQLVSASPKLAELLDFKNNYYKLVYIRRTPSLIIFCFSKMKISDHDIWNKLNQNSE